MVEPMSYGLLNVTVHYSTKSHTSAGYVRDMGKQRKPIRRRDGSVEVLQCKYEDMRSIPSVHI